MERRCCCCKMRDNVANLVSNSSTRSSSDWLVRSGSLGGDGEGVIRGVPLSLRGELLVSTASKLGRSSSSSSSLLVEPPSSTRAFWMDGVSGEETPCLSSAHFRLLLLLCCCCINERHRASPAAVSSSVLSSSSELPLLLPLLESTGKPTTEPSLADESSNFMVCYCGIVVRSCGVRIVMMEER